jgi:hypothetical protein
VINHNFDQLKFDQVIISRLICGPTILVKIFTLKSQFDLYADRLIREYIRYIEITFHFWLKLSQDPLEVIKSFDLKKLNKLPELDLQLIPETTIINCK